MNAEAVPIVVGDLLVRATPQGGDRTDQGSEWGIDLFIESIARNGGISVTRLVAVKGGQLPSDPMVWNQKGYAVMMLLWGSAMVEHEYVEAPHLIVLRPESPRPELHEGAEAVIVSLGAVDVFNPESRLKFSLPHAARMSLEMNRGIRSAIGQSRMLVDQMPSDDVHFWILSEGGNAEARRPHTHGTGGEVVLMFHGLLKDRGGWELGPFDVLVYGPNSSHGPAVGPQGAIALTINLGDRAE